MKNIVIYVMFINCVKLKENVLKHKKDVCSKKVLTTQRKVFALKDC